jgi:nucleotide-binding universal stress UspA family protein
MMSDSAALNGHRIVVGVDGSPTSISALRWAIRQGRLTGARVDAVTAWRYPATFADPTLIDSTDYEDDARRILTQTIAENPSGNEVQVRPLVMFGHPAQVLLDAADGADLLVVGSRGHGGFTEAMLGSVGQHLVHHAPCPVVIIRGKEAAPDPGR